MQYNLNMFSSFNVSGGRGVYRGGRGGTLWNDYDFNYKPPGLVRNNRDNKVIIICKT